MLDYEIILEQMRDKSCILEDRITLSNIQDFADN